MRDLVVQIFRLAMHPFSTGHLALSLNPAEMMDLSFTLRRLWGLPCSFRRSLASVTEAKVEFLLESFVPANAVDIVCFDVLDLLLRCLFSLIFLTALQCIFHNFLLSNAVIPCQLLSSVVLAFVFEWCWDVRVLLWSWLNKNHVKTEENK